MMSYAAFLASLLYAIYVHRINLIIDSEVTISFVNMELGHKSRKCEKLYPNLVWDYNGCKH